MKRVACQFRLLIVIKEKDIMRKRERVACLIRLIVVSNRERMKQRGVLSLVLENV